MGALWEAQEEQEEAMAGSKALSVAVHRLVQKLDYEQTARKDISYLGLHCRTSHQHQTGGYQVWNHRHV